MRNYSECAGGTAASPEWKLPISLKMIPTSMMSEIKIKHKYTTGVDKTYEGFSKLRQRESLRPTCGPRPRGK